MRVAILGASASTRQTLAAALQQLLPELHINANCALMRQAEAHAADSAPWPVHSATKHRQDFALSLLLPPESAHPSNAELRLREWLLQHALPFACVFGSAAQQSANARAAIAHQIAARSAAPEHGSDWHWNCENCSDAACERRLFSTLLQRAADH